MLISVGMVGAFAFPAAIVAQAVSTMLPAASGRNPYWRQSLPTKGEKCGFSSFELESYSIFVTRVCVTFLCHGRERDEIVAHLENMGYVVHFNAYSSVLGAETYRKVTIRYDRSFSPFARPRGLLHSR